MAVGESGDAATLLEHERLRRITSAVPVGFLETDALGSVTWASARFCELAGASFEAVCASGWMNSVHPQDRDYVQHTWNDAVKNARAAELHFRFVRPPDTIYARLLLAPEIGSDGRVRHFSAAVTNITEFVNTAAQIQERSAQFRAIAEAMPQFAWIAAADGTIEYFNKPWLDYTGLTVAGVQRKGEKGVVHPEDLDLTWERWRAALAGGEPFEIEYRLRRKRDGAYRWFIARATPVHGPDGRVDRWIGTATDIDSQKRANANLQFVIDASARMSGSYDVDSICRSLANLAVDRVADLCTIVLLDEHGEYVLAADAVRDPSLERYARQLRKGRRGPLAPMLDQCVRENAPLLIPHLDDPGGPLAQLRSAMIVPLCAPSGAAYGALAMASLEPGHAYTTQDLEVTQMVAQRAASAIDTAKAFDVERRRAQRLQLIARASELIFESFDLQSTFANVTAFVAAELAEFAYIQQIEDGSALRTVACAHRDPQKKAIVERLQGQRTLRPDAEERAIRVLAQHQAVVTPTVSLQHVLADMWEYSAQDVRALKIRSAITVPLYSRGQTLGALVAYRCDGACEFALSDLPVFNDLGRRLSIAIEHVNALQRERRIAEALQQALLPSSERLPERPDLSFNAEYRPSSQEADVGGDWYDAVALPDGAIMVSVGDVTGRGLEAAGLMGKVRQAINMAAMYERDPSRILDAVDFQLRSRSSDAIVTAFVGFIEDGNRTMRYANAGHPPPLLRRGTELLELRSNGGLPLGLRNHVSAEHVQTISLENAQLLALYTDGLVEGTRDLAFGERRLRQIASSQAILYVRNPARFLCDACLPFEAQDDSAVLTVLFGARTMWSFNAENAQAAHDARDQFLAALRRSAAPNSDFNAAELIFGELIGNVVRHAPGKIDVQLDWRAEHPILHVTDRGRGFVRDAALPPNPLSESGRGLYIIAKLARSVQVERIPGYGNHIAVELKLRKA